MGLDPDVIPSRISRQAFSHEVIDVLEPFATSVISFHFGLPKRDLLYRLKSWRPTILSTATTVDEALWLQENGADAIIAQGIEAGGHRGMFLSQDLMSQSNTKALVKQIKESINLPVIAAGGISSSNEVVEHLENGAQAIQIGTSYLLSTEAKTSIFHRQAIQSNQPPKTALTNLFSGRPARAIVNRVIKELGPLSKYAPAYPHAATTMSYLRKTAEGNGSSDFTPLWCGQNTRGCDSISAYDLTLRLARKLESGDFQSI